MNSSKGRNSKFHSTQLSFQYGSRIGNVFHGFLSFLSWRKKSGPAMTLRRIKYVNKREPKQNVSSTEAGPLFMAIFSVPITMPGMLQLFTKWMGNKKTNQSPIKKKIIHNKTTAKMGQQKQKTYVPLRSLAFHQLSCPFSSLSSPPGSASPKSSAQDQRQNLTWEKTGRIRFNMLNHLFRVLAICA